MVQNGKKKILKLAQVKLYRKIFTKPVRLCLEMFNCMKCKVKKNKRQYEDENKNQAKSEKIRRSFGTILRKLESAKLRKTNHKKNISIAV